MTIFVTIGGQEPFDRLIRAMDLLAPALIGFTIIAQVLNSKYKAKNIKTIGYLSPKEFDYYFNKAALIVGHAGMGTILTALQRGKPILVLPRKIEFNEHRSNHQFSTAKKMAELKYAHVAYDQDELGPKILEIVNSNFRTLFKINSHASFTLLDSIRKFTEEIKTS